MTEQGRATGVDAVGTLRQGLIIGFVLGFVSAMATAHALGVNDD